MNIPATFMGSFKWGLTCKFFLGLYPFFLWITAHNIFYLTKVRGRKPLLNTIYITSSQNTTKFYCTVWYNMFYNYMFRPLF